MTTDFIPLVLFAISMTLTPGPNNIMIMNSGMYFGIKKSLPHYWGICVGFPLMVLMVSLGLGAIFVKYAWIKQILKIAGSIYMLYLSYQILTSHSDPKSAHARHPLKFYQAVGIQWVNPKAWMIAVGMISIFTLTSYYFYNAVLISALLFVVCIPCIGIWLLFGKFLQQILKKDSHRVWFNIAMALSLVASIAMIFID